MNLPKDPAAQTPSGDDSSDAPARAPASGTLDPSAVMLRVRAELARRGVELDSDTQDAASADVIERWRPSAARLPDKPQYTLADFLAFDDADFIDTVYRKLLWRPSGDAGSRAYLEALRSGAIGKVELLGMVRFSDEGRQKAVHVDGLLLPYKLRCWCRLPIVGYVLRFALAIRQLPRLTVQLQQIEARSARESHAAGHLLNRRAQGVERTVATLADVQRVEVEELRKTQQADLDALRKTQQAAIDDLHARVEGEQRRLRSMLERLTVFLDTHVPRAAGENTGREPLIAPEREYAGFEDVFRGDRNEIKLRVAHYLQTLSAAAIQPGPRDVVLDLGSGRGEWLEVLAEHGYRGRGVDTNRGMLERSIARGHDVIEADALAYLRAQDDNAFAAVTAMHLVEHIPYAALVELLSQALRVLRPGGVLILETPNPENILVGACYFYMDPTHRNPIPPQLLQWNVEARGFEHVVIDRLSEHRGVPTLHPVADDVAGASQINQMVAWFTAPPDYAVIARKPASVRLA